MTLPNNNNDLIVAIIGARSGSKIIKDKNIRFLNGQPLIFRITKIIINTLEIIKGSIHAA